MAYSDYGGHVYVNGELDRERCDAEGFHAILGYGPIQVGMYKQNYTEFLKNGTKLQASTIKNVRCEKEFDHIDDDWYRHNSEFLTCEIDGYKISIWYEVTDNYYQYAKMIEPDGTVWTGFSGYGVGNGLEDSPYHGFDTNVCIDRMKELFDNK
jgi:hypothetical protein